jgi:hypothetical protein
MDYKKIIIINLAFLVILGKLLQFIFNKMQRNLSRIEVEKNEVLKFIFNYNNSYYNITEDEEPKLKSFDNLQKFSKDIHEILNGFKFMIEGNKQIDEVK